MDWRWSIMGVVIVTALVRYAITEPWRTQPLPMPHLAERAQAANEITEVPAYPEAEVVESVKVHRGSSLVTTTIYHVESEPGELESWYKTELQSRGWRVTRMLLGPEDKDEAARVLVALQSNRRLEISWSERADKPLRTVSQMLMEPAR